MDIESLDEGNKARVRFDTHDERWAFGDAVRFSSLEGLRFWNYVGAGMLSLGLVRPYSHKPEDYPQFVDMRVATLGRALGNLSMMRDLSGKDVAIPSQHMTEVISEYFSELAAEPVVA
ncbi:MAG TPA: hypothetical protein VFH99_02645 [Candidatus Saccharimonadales bacterium]|nr:hypothetical protein [Candidatus Saccharimonadales bacterium]